MKNRDEDMGRIEVCEDDAVPRIKTIGEFVSKISVELTLFLYMMAFMITAVVENAFFVYKACLVNHKYPHDICINIQNYSDINKEVQKTTSEFLQYNSIAGHVIPIVLALFMGSFSDKRGRKLPLIMGLTGKLIYSVMIIFNTIFVDWPIEYIIYTATIPSAFTGADVAIFANAFSYISDVSSVRDRTLRITILDVTYLSTMPTGVALGNYLFKYLDKSFTKMFIINASLMLLSVLYSLIKLKWQTTPKQRPLTDLPPSKWLKDFFDKNHLKQTIRTLVKKRDNNFRNYIIIVMISMALYAFQRDEKPYLYLYAQLKLGWTVDLYSHFKTYQSAAFVIVMLVAMPLMNKLWKFKDTSIILIGATAHSLGRLFFIFAQGATMMFIGATVGALGPCVAPALRSVTSKLVPIEERGSIFALLSVCDNAVPLLNGVLYTQVYKLFINDFPAAIFLLTMLTQIIVFLLITYVHVSNPFERKKESNSLIIVAVEKTEKK